MYVRGAGGWTLSEEVSNAVDDRATFQSIHHPFFLAILGRPLPTLQGVSSHPYPPSRCSASSVSGLVLLKQHRRRRLVDVGAVFFVRSRRLVLGELCIRRDRGSFLLAVKGVCLSTQALRAREDRYRAAHRARAWLPARASTHRRSRSVARDADIKNVLPSSSLGSSVVNIDHKLDQQPITPVKTSISPCVGVCRSPGTSFREFPFPGPTNHPLPRYQSRRKGRHAA